ncbi:MAG: molecular chaperone DnaJ [Dethiobacteria bacterium]
MSEKDLYNILGVSREATQDEIKRAYRRLARKYHPDMNDGDEEKAEKFKQITEAYDILSDSAKRDNYDRFGSTGDPMGGFGGGFQGDFAGFGFEDIFEGFFGGGFGSRRSYGPRRGNDLRYDMELTLEEAFSGIQKEIRIPRTESCAVCGGSGAKKGTAVETCAVCQGSGQEKIIKNTIYGRFVNVQTCGSCHGKGKIIKEPCTKCHGKGQVLQERRVEVKIPPGVDNGTQLRMSGEGEPGTRGGPHGDLYIYLSISPHKLFARKGSTLIYELPVSFAQLAMGASLEIPTLEGKASLHIPEGTQPDKVFRMRGKGMPRLRGLGRGDLNVMLKLVVPKRLNKEQKEALIQFSHLCGEDYAEEGKGFINRVREAFGGGK